MDLIVKRECGLAGVPDLPSLKQMISRFRILVPFAATEIAVSVNEIYKHPAGAHFSICFTQERRLQ